MYVPPCHPESNGLSADVVYKKITSTMPRKIDEVKSEWCANCAIQPACLAQGFWTNEDGKRVALDGIFGGLTQDERKALL